MAEISDGVMKYVTEYAALPREKVIALLYGNVQGARENLKHLKELGLWKGETPKPVIFLHATVNRLEAAIRIVLADQKHAAKTTPPAAAPPAPAAPVPPSVEEPKSTGGEEQLRAEVEKLKSENAALKKPKMRKVEGGRA